MTTLLFSSGSLVYTGDKFSGVYGIQNHDTGKWYVGESINVPLRISRYLSGNTKSQRYIHAAISKYGIQSFSCYLLEQVHAEELHSKELYWGHTLNSLAPNGYNLQIGGKGKQLFSDETRAKISAATRGRRLSEQHKQRIAAAKLGKKIGPYTTTEVCTNRASYNKQKENGKRGKYTRTAKHRMDASARERGRKKPKYTPERLKAHTDTMRKPEVVAKCLAATLAYCALPETKYKRWVSKEVTKLGIYLRNNAPWFLDIQ